MNTEYQVECWVSAGAGWMPCAVMAKTLTAKLHALAVRADVLLKEVDA